MNIRPTKLDDIPALQKVLDNTELFPSEMLPDMVAGFLEHDDGSEIWLTNETAGQAIGFCSVSYTHLRAHETGRNLVCRLLLEK